MSRTTGPDADVDGSWDDIADWWVDAVRTHPDDSTAMAKVLDELLRAAPRLAGANDRGRTLDLGCGEGSSMRTLGPRCVGTDSSMQLLARAHEVAPVVCASLPDLSWVRPGSIRRSVAVGVLDLLADAEAFFRSVAAAMEPGGDLLVVVNHPVTTAPGSEPLVDPDGEILWRWGTYLVTGSWEHPAGRRTVRFHHRPVSALLTAAATAGWHLAHVVERGPSDAALDGGEGYRGHEQCPTLLGVRWTLPATP